QIMLLYRAEGGLYMEYDMSILKNARKKRRIVYEIIKNPGIRPKDLSKSLGLSLSALGNQLPKLCAANIIYVKRDKKSSHYFINELFSMDHPEYNTEMDHTTQKPSTHVTMHHEKSTISTEMALFLIKNVLYNSQAIQALTILDNWDIFISWFSIEELIILLYELGICIDIGEESLFISNIEYSSVREELLACYKDIVYYVSMQEEKLKSKRLGSVLG
ncbi:MAG: winged helix-turn-helix transcriptional regulator, partial [Bacilli bacterium]|nr:winged helix-turn-helix transcriptional regulator [Bacilli bacterium]